jgi:two-component system cell cycle sensor histidine kinase/response regulator CckA
MASEATQSAAQGDIGTILIVDGEPAVREIAKLTLESHGYCVLVAEDGAKGFAMYVDNAGAIGLVISDMDIPILSEAAMIRYVERLNPNIRILSTSTLVDKRRGPPPPSRAWLPKPYTPQQLLSTVHAVLHAG